MSEKFTPGPWRTDVDIFHDRLDIRDGSGRRVAVCIHDYPMSMARHDANANLIAAAPELYDALELIYGRLLMSDRDGESRITAEDGEMAELALKKARGEL